MVVARMIAVALLVALVAGCLVWVDYEKDINEQLREQNQILWDFAQAQDRYIRSLENLNSQYASLLCMVAGWLGLSDSEFVAWHIVE